MGRVDRDRLERDAARAAERGVFLTLDGDEAGALVAELRVAREVVEVARVAAAAVRSSKSAFTELARLLVAIEVYDQTVQHLDDPGTETQVSRGTPWDKGG